MQYQIDNILKYLKRSFYLLFVILVFIAIFFIFLVNKSYQDLNQYSEASSLDIYNAVLNEEQNSLSKLVHDYSYWTSAVEAITGEVDYVFVDDSYDGEYLKESYSVDGLVVYHLDGSLQLTVSDQGRDAVPNQFFSQPEFEHLFKQALNTNYKHPTPVSSFITYKGKAQLVSASVIVPSVFTDKYPTPQPYGVLLMIRPIDEALLTKWRDDYSLHHIKVISGNQHTPSGNLSSFIKDPYGKDIYKLIWQPDLPGAVFIDELMPIAIIIIIALIVISILFSLQLNNYIRLTLNAAKDLVESKEQLHRLAHYDSITHLPNRLLGMDRLEQALHSNARNKTSTAVLFIDLDDFKPVNDKYGHDMGDRLLTTVGQLLDSCIRRGVDTVSRLGGDEFVVILANLKHKDDAAAVAEKIINLLSDKITIDDVALQVGASIGISITDSPKSTCDEMMKKADDAMYKAKGKGKNRYYVAD